MGKGVVDIKWNSPDKDPLYELDWKYIIIIFSYKQSNKKPPPKKQTRVMEQKQNNMSFSVVSFIFTYYYHYELQFWKPFLSSDFQALSCDTAIVK